ncbi:MAG: SIS domain-containing protein [Micromonosporaceae bacterium]
MSHAASEIASQPECWRRAAALTASGQLTGLPRPGERVAIAGCGTSWFIAQSYAARRESMGLGESDAFAASEMPPDRRYDRVLAITRSGTTTEVLELLTRLPSGTPTVVITGTADSPVIPLAGDTILLDWADEKSVVQTRFATATLALLRAHLGEDLTAAIADAERALADPLPVDPATLEQVTFLGQGWTTGLANEAALKLREAATFWTEAYPAMDYRHGPISIAEPGRAVWSFGTPPEGLADDVAATGASFVHDDLDPMADLVRAQRLALALAEHRGLDIDSPRHLTRSVVLD